MGAIRNTKRMIQLGPVQYNPNIFNNLIIRKNGWGIEHDESDDIETVKTLSSSPPPLCDFYTKPKYINPNKFTKPAEKINYILLESEGTNF